MAQLDIHVGDKVKSLDTTGCEIIGSLEQMGEEYYIGQTASIYENNTYLGFKTIHYKVFRNRCAKWLAQLQDGNDIFHGDIFSTYDGTKFCISYIDETMSVVYTPITADDLPSNINIYECYYVGNMIIDDKLEWES